MKKIVCLSIFLSVIISLGYSQSIRKFKIDTFSLKVPNRITEMPFTFKPNDYSNLLREGSGNLFPKTFPRPFDIKVKSFGGLTQSSIDNMPIIKPEGNFSMRIFKPDTTVRYSLQIKELSIKEHVPLRR